MIPGAPPARGGRTLVLGVGNRIMTDDAVGLEALAALERGYRLPAAVDLVDGGTLGLDLLVHIEGYPRVLVLDCVMLGREPGTVVRVERDEIPAVLGRCLSPHQVGLQDLLGVLQLLDRTPERLTVIGVEPERIDPGLDLSAPVRAALPRMLEAAAGVLREWGLPVGRRPGPGG